MSKQLRIWLFVLLSTLLTSTTLPAEGVITMTTSKRVGKSIELRIWAKDPITIEGVWGGYAPIDGSTKYYTLESQTITIRGNVTELDCSFNQLTSLDVSGCTALTKLDCSSNQLTSLNVSGCTSLTELECRENQLTSLDVSGCTALTEFNCYNNQLTSLNVSGCTALTKLKCSYNQLTSLDLSGCTALTSLTCSDNPLTSINLSGCQSLKEFSWTSGKLTSLDVSGCTALTKLYCRGNQLTSLDVSGCTALKELQCQRNQLTSLDASGCRSLTTLDCSKNQLTCLNVSGCIALTQLTCYDNPLTRIDLSNCKLLKEFTWHGGKLTSLDVSGCTALTKLECYDNQINGENMTKLVTSLPSRKGMSAGSLVVVNSSEDEKNLCRPSDIAIAQEKNWTLKWKTGNPYKGIGEGVITMTSSKAVGRTVQLRIEANSDVLIEGVRESPPQYRNNYTLTSQTITIRGDVTELSCNDNQLTSLDVSKNTALTMLSCNGNQLTRLDLSGCPALTELDCNNNQLTSLDVSKNTALRELSCNDNQLTSLDVSGCTALTLLSCYYNHLTSLDVSGCTSLKELDCNNNQLTSLDVSGRTALTMLDCSKNQLTRLDVSDCTSLGQLDCSNNPLASIDLSNCKSLKEFTWNKKELTSLDVSGCTSLTKLDCSDNQLTGLKVSGCTVLTKLDCWSNQLTSLDVSGCSALTELDCNNNQLINLDVSNCTSLTKLVCYKNRLKGEAMTQMVAGLSDRSENESGSLYVVCDESDENDLLRSDVLTASRKNWRVFKYIVNTGKSVLYSGAGGDDEIVMTITKEQYLEGGIRLAILADGDVTIEGVHEKRIFTDGSERTYTLAGTQITIRGNVSELDCSKNQLTNIDVSKSTSLWTLKCSDNKLTSLNASGSSLLTEVNCSNNRLTSLDVSGCASLETLECDNNHLTSLNISGCVALKTLYCYSNCINGEAMTKLVNSLPDRKGLSSGTLRVVVNDIQDKNWCSFADVATASAKNWAVQKYERSNWKSYPGVGEGVITMTTSKAVGEKVYLRIEANGDVVIEGISEMPQLSDIYSSSYTLTSQTITFRGDVTELDCFGNQLTSLNVSGCTALTKLDCQDNQLSSLNVSGCTALTKLDCYNNQLSSLELSQNRALTRLDCSRNKLESLDLSACTRLESLECYRNKLRGKAVAQLVESLPDRYGKDPGKFYFVYYSNDEYEENFCYRPAVGRASDKNWRPQKLSSGWEDYFGVIDEGVVMMRTAQKVGSKITLTLEAKGDVAIDGVKGVPETDGKPHQYTLISQDVTIRGYVTKLHCSGNKLTSLDLSTTVPLVELDCSNNQLTALDVSHNAAVTSLTCYRNQIKGDAMAQLIKGLPQLPLRSTHLFGIVSNAADEGNVFLKADVERVRDKGWSPMKWDEERQKYEPYAGKETESFAVTLTKEGKGTITATGADDLTAVPYGTELTIVATPTEGYALISLTAGEEDILATKKVVVTDNVTVNATFEEATFAVTLTSNEHGDITIVEPVDLKAVPYGTTLTVKATGKNAQCVLTELTANGEDILSTQSFVVTDVTEVKATFVDHTGVETTVTQETQLYPNPATDYVIVEGVAPASEVTLHSMTGERLYAGRADDRGTLQIDLTPYADGVYLVCVAGETYRVVVRR